MARDRLTDERASARLTYEVHRMQLSARMTLTMRKTVFTIATLCGLAACAADTSDEDAADRRKPRPPTTQVDAGTTPQPDASSGGTSGDGTVSCYTEGAPSNTCSLPVHCCFTNYSAQHNGYCTSDSCAWGTLDCDGPEDCATGEHCCSQQLQDADGIAGYRVACQASACGAPPTGEELCHPNSASCGSGETCVTAYGNNNDLPRSLYICR